MISQTEYTSRVEKLVSSGMDERIAGTKAVIDFGLENKTITSAEAETSLDTLRSFLQLHPDHQFLTAHERARRRKEGTLEADTAEREMWSRVQPVLDKAQRRKRFSRKKSN